MVHLLCTELRANADVTIFIEQFKNTEKQEGKLFRPQFFLSPKSFLGNYSSQLKANKVKR